MDTTIYFLLGAVFIISYLMFWKNYKYIVGITLLLMGLMVAGLQQPTDEYNLKIYDNDTSTTIKDYNFTTENTTANQEMQTKNLVVTSIVLTGLGIVFIDVISRVSKFTD